jgi:hypothetical protein
MCLLIHNYKVCFQNSLQKFPTLFTELLIPDIRSLQQFCVWFRHKENSLYYLVFPLKSSGQSVRFLHELEEG